MFRSMMSRLFTASHLPAKRTMCRQRLRLESLERRELMAVDLSIQPTDNFLPPGSVNKLQDNYVVVAADFERNGFADVLYINKETGQNRIVSNQGNGEFINRDDSLPRGAINGLYNSNVVLAGDFDHNGFDDVLYINKQSGQNRLVRNLGNLQFSTSDDFLPRGSVNGLNDNNIVLAGDFDRNGWADVLYINKGSGENRIVQSLGNGQFANRDNTLPREALQGLYDNNVVVAGDFDRNGFSDVLCIDKMTGQNRLVLNQGGFQFLALKDPVFPLGYANKLYDQNFAVTGDFDRDGDAELIYINKDSGVNRALGLRSATLNAGILTVRGTNNGDRISITSTADEKTIIVDRNGITDAFSATAVQQILVNGMAGDDTVTNDTWLRSSLFGGDGNDRLFGGKDYDYLDGGAGNDILFAGYQGVNPERLIGGSGNDLFLLSYTPRTDMLVSSGIGDFELRSDARIDFVPGSKIWTDSEIANVSDGFSRLLARTRNTILLKQSPYTSGQPIRFERDINLGDNVLADNDSQGLIRFADLAFDSTVQDNSPVWATAIHEIGHNWDTLKENPSFNFSPFGTGTTVSWYANTNAREDFAETLVATFLSNDRYHPENAPLKITAMNQWLDSLTG